MSKFKIKSYTGTVHTKHPQIKLNQILRFISKHQKVHIRNIVNPKEEFSDTEEILTSLVKYINLNSLSHFIVSSIYSNCDMDGDYLTILVFDPDYDLPF